jgi:hypothetical protein
MGVPADTGAGTNSCSTLAHIWKEIHGLSPEVKWAVIMPYQMRRALRFGLRLAASQISSQRTVA